MRRTALVVALLTVAATMSIPQGAQAFAGYTNEAIAVWQHRDVESATGWDIWWSSIGRPPAQPATANLDWNTPSGSHAAAIATLAGDDKNPHVASLEGTTIAVWQHAPGTGAQPGGWDIYWSRLTGSGTWSAPALLAVDAGDDYDPNVAIDSNGSAIAVWVHRQATGARILHSSTFNGATWSTPIAVNEGPGQASLPEISVSTASSSGGVLAHRAVVAWADAALQSQKMFYATFNAGSWSPTGLIESVATGISDTIRKVGYEDYSGAESDPFGSFSRLGVTADGVGNVFVVWGGTYREYSEGIVGAILNVAAGTWTPMLSGGGRYIGVSGCQNPDAALSTGGGDFIGVFDFAGYIEDTFRIGGDFTGESYAYDSPEYDWRPSDVAISPKEIVSVNWTEPSEGGDEEIVWSVATIDPGVGRDWQDPARPIVTGGLAGEDRYPEIASGFVPSLLGADSWTANLRVGSGSVAAAVNTLSFARVLAPGSKHNWVFRAVLPNGLGDVYLGDNTATASAAGASSMSSSATATVSRVTLTIPGQPAIVAEGLRAVSSSSLSGGVLTSTSSGTRLARLTVGTTVIPLDGSPQTIPLGTSGFLKILESVPTSTSTVSELQVNVIHVGVTLGGTQIDLTIGSAYSGVTAGGALTPRPATTPMIEPALP